MGCTFKRTFSGDLSSDAISSTNSNYRQALSGNLIHLDDNQELKKQVKRTFEKPKSMPKCPGTKVYLLDS